MVEILSNHFNEEEVSKVEKEIERDVSFREVYDRIKAEPNFRMSALEERIDKTEETFVTRFEAFKKAVLEAEKNKTPIEQIQQTIKEKAKSKKDEAIKALKEKADKVLPFGIGSSLFDWASDLIKGGQKKEKGILGNIFGKVGASIGIFVLGLLGLKKGYESLSLEKVDDDDTELESEQVKQSEPEQIEQSADEVDEEKLTVEKRKSIYYSGGIILIKSLSGVRFEERSTEYIYNGLKTKKLSLIEKEYEQYKKSNNYNILIDNLGLKGVGKNEKNQVLNVLESISGKNTQNFLSSRFKNIKNGFFTEEMREKFGEDFVSRIEGNINKAEYKELTLEEVSIAFALSIPAFIGELGTKTVGRVSALYNSKNELTDEIKDEFEKRRENLISTSLLQKLFSLGGANFGSTKHIEGTKIYDLFENKNISDTEKKELQKLIDFKNAIIPILVTNKEFNFDIDDFESKLNNSITYSSIVELYLLLNGNIENIKGTDVLTKSAILFIIRNIFESNKDYQGQYLGAITHELMKHLNEEASDKLTEDEATFLSIQADKFGKEFLKKYFDKIAEFRSGGKEVIVKEVEDKYKIKVPENAANMGEYVALLGVAGTLWKLKKFTPTGLLWTGAAGIGIWGLSVLSESELYQNYKEGKLKELSEDGIKIFKQVDDFLSDT